MVDIICPKIWVKKVFTLQQIVVMGYIESLSLEYWNFAFLLKKRKLLISEN